MSMQSSGRAAHLRARGISLVALFAALALYAALAAPMAFARELRQDAGSVVQVSLVDGQIQMPAELPAGPTTFEVSNSGSFGHSFEIEGQGIDQALENTLQPGESGSLQVDLQPGDYRVYCPVDDHAARGMELTLTVTAAEGAGTVPPAEATAQPPEEETAQPAEEATAQPAEEATPTPEEEAAPMQMEMAAETVQPTGTLLGEPAIALVKVADGLADPVNVAAAPDGSGRIFVVERVGRIRIIQDGQLLEQPFLDIKEIVKYDFLEQGLLGLAFHPNYAENGRFFVYYVDWQTNGDVYLVEYHVSQDDPNVADPESGRVLLTQDKPFVNHNGGTIHFGPDGYLYVAIGDGGLAGDPYRNAQDLNTWLGKILRIDVDAGGQPYGIPDDNPFTRQVLESNAASDAAQTGGYLPDARREIWAYGLRNPWQFSFDSATGDLYIADVGQNLWEEINVQPAGSPGGWNFGWPFMEASHCYLPGSDCGPIGQQPVAEYDHSEENCTVVGLGVYRGQVSTALDGIYFASDYCSGKVWGLARDEGGAWAFAELLDTELAVSGAGRDEAGELYVTTCTCEYDRAYDPEESLGGAVWQLMAADVVPEGAETAPLQAAAPEEGAEAAAAADANLVQVSLVDGEIVMPASLPAGPTSFEVTNDGSFDHNFEIEGGDVDAVFDQNLAPGESNTLTVDLPPGEYEVYCPVSDHAQRGMKLTLVVQ